ncbi:MAG: aminoglycoside adenylyltransferase domain-containing protein [Dehalococcoidia bacterium]
MGVVAYPAVDSLLEDLLTEIREHLGDRLVGLYVYGSLVTGDSDEGISDIDLLAVTSDEINDADFSRLDAMHNSFISARSEWQDRLEIAYLSLQALRTFKIQPSRAAIISPGEPFHFKEVGADWLINWWMVSEEGITLFGPPPATIIEPISNAEVIAASRKQAADWPAWIRELQPSRPYQGYAVLTMCRAFYAHELGAQASKKRAAAWAAERLPEWAGLIQSAMAWREEWRNREVDPQATLPEVVKFVDSVAKKIAG